MHTDGSTPSLSNSSRLRAGFRVLAYVCLVACAVLALSARAAYADLERTVLRLGEKLVSELGPSFVGDPQAVMFNGQPLFLGAQISDLSVHQVLDGFAANCLGRASDIRALLGVTGKPSPLAESGESQWSRLLDRARVLRTESDDEGVLSCFAPTKHGTDIAGLVEGARSFMDTGDLSELGDLRYVTARREPSGRTQVVAVWTEGEFRLATLFPETGDAPGSDLTDVPRPPSATRSLCATAPQRSFSFRLYESEQTIAEVLSFYEHALPDTGWRAVPLADVSTSAANASLMMRAFSRDGRALGIGVDRDRGGKTQISLVDLGRVQQSRVLAKLIEP